LSVGEKIQKKYFTQRGAESQRKSARKNPGKIVHADRRRLKYADGRRAEKKRVLLFMIFVEG
jgi:hypothetical protein